MRGTGVGLGLLGWALFGFTLWYEHRQPPPEIVPPKTAAALHDAGFTESKVGPVPPPAIVTKTVTIPGAERIVYVQIEAKPSEKEAPTVRFIPGNCTADAAQLPNWSLRPGDLGLRDGSLDVRKVGRHAFVAFKGTVTAQTPEGDVSRTITPEADAWVSTKALALPPRFGPTVRVSTIPALEIGVYWTKGRKQWDATVGQDFDRHRWFGAGGVRF